MCLYEYWQLRNEIRDRLLSIRNIVLGCYAAVGGVIAGGLAVYSQMPDRLDLVSLVFLAPFIAIVPSFSFVTSEEISIAILARYIRLHVELPFFADSIKRRKAGDQTIHLPFGWETYLYIVRDAQMRLDDKKENDEDGVFKFAWRAVSAALTWLRDMLRPIVDFLADREAKPPHSLTPTAEAGSDSNLHEPKVPIAKIGLTAAAVASNGLDKIIADFTDQNKAAIRLATRRDRHQNRAVSRFFRLAGFSCLIASVTAASLYGMSIWNLNKSSPQNNVWPLMWIVLWLTGFISCLVQTVRLHRDMKECWKEGKFVDVDSLPIELCEKHLQFFER